MSTNAQRRHLEASRLHTVTFQDRATGIWQHSRTCDGKNAAMKWAEWVAAQSWTQAVKVHKGQAGGELIAQLGDRTFAEKSSVTPLL